MTFAGSGINVGDSVWLRIGDGEDNLDTGSLDEPIVDNLTLTVVPEPSAPLVLLLGAAALAGSRRRAGGRSLDART